MNFKREIRKLITITYAIVISVLLYAIFTIVLVFGSFTYNIGSLSYFINKIHIQEFIKLTFETDNNTAATLTITLLVFVTGLILSLITLFIKNLIVRYKYRVLFRSIIKGISKSCSKKSKQFYEFTKLLDIKSNAGFRLKSDAITHLENIDKIDFNHFYEAFFMGAENLFNNKKKTATWDKLWGCIAQIKNVESRYVNQFNLFGEKYQNLDDKRNESIRELKIILDKLHDDILAKNNTGEIKQEYVTYINAVAKIQNDWNNLKVENRTLPFIFNEHYIQPILNLNRQNPELKLPERLNHYLLLTDHYFASLKLLVEGYNSAFMSYYRGYKLYSKLLMIGSIKLKKIGFLFKVSVIAEYEKK